MAILNEGGGSTLYAELLSNIRQISVAATLPSPPTSDTVARITEDGRQLRLEHDGLTSTLHLPAVVAKTSLRPACGASRHLTWRLPLSSVGGVTPPFSPENQAVPWAAFDLENGSAVRCRTCSSVIVPSGTLRVWKDLPSENWAEMMEFWHCHKPHDHDQQDNGNLANKGYGANNAISAQPGVGLVDITSFMFDERDCHNLSFSVSGFAEASNSSSKAVEGSKPGKYLGIFCNHCAAEIGLFSTIAGSVTLFKWRVSCTTTPPTSRAPTGPECLAAALTANISRSGCAKSLIMPHVSDEGPEPRKMLYLWVLNPNVVYSSSIVGGKRSAMKILFREVLQEEGNRLLDSVVSDVQDLYFSAATIDLARESLAMNSRLLPETERSFKEWQVGLLDRWEASNNEHQRSGG
ncbi:hypothetical protein E4U42_002928 [Claviceps africana]|uniref:Ubiquitin-conjugating enzyme E2C-binding protein n=1 Tax=Claviceps africana TaxID=83212 RepID=A0A8K0J7N4_9HYPO|nr:hypothetical protein E4U42_002928 [Claviceps africana]